MVLNLKPATALLGLLTADPLQMTAAERSRREQLLDASGNKKERLANLVLDAEFHRAMLANAEAAAPAGGTERPVGQRRAVQTGNGGGAREKFADQPRIQRLLANIRRKRALTGTVKRGVASSRTERDVVDTVEDILGQEDQDILDLVECSPNVVEEATNADADVGHLWYQTDENLPSDLCDEGYTCLPSSSSALGGLCTPTSTQRALQYCPAGCPTAVCDCYENYDLEDPACIDALVDSCRDGSYVNYCGPSDPLEQAYSQAYCDAYICLDDSGLTDSIPGNSVCDISDTRCAGCYCTLYGSLCNIFRPICAQGSDAYVCYDIDYVCDISECCDQFGPSECVGNPGSLEPTPEPTEPPIGGMPTPPSAASDLLPGGAAGRYALLGASVVAAGLAQTLF